MMKIGGPSNGTPDAQTSERVEAMKRIAENYNNRRGNLNEKDGYNCDLCLNRGEFVYVREYAPGCFEQTVKFCKCRKARKALRNLRESGLQGVLEDFTLANFDATLPYQKQMLESAQTYVNSKSDKWFALLGASGSGKTHLCSAVSINFLRHGREVYYMRWRDDVRQIMQENHNGNRELLDRIKVVDVLYIDDLFKTAKGADGIQKPSEAEIRLAFEIINTRCAAKKITVISSESVLSNLAKIDEAIAGRIKQMCGAYLVNIPTSNSEDRNYRMRGA